MTAMRPKEGAAFCISAQPPPNGSCGGLRAVLLSGALSRSVSVPSSGLACETWSSTGTSWQVVMNEAAADRAVGVLRREDRGRRGGSPTRPRTGSPPPRRAGCRPASSSSELTTLNVRVRSGVAAARSLSAGRSCATVGARRAHERPDLVADDRRRLAHERAHGAQRRPERARAGPQRLQRRPELVGQRLGLAERRAGSRRARTAARSASRAGSRPGGRGSRRRRSSSRRTRPAGRPWRRARPSTSERLWIDAPDVLPALARAAPIDLARRSARSARSGGAPARARAPLPRSPSAPAPRRIVR